MKKYLFSLLALCALFVGQAHAVLDPAVTVAMTDIQTDGLSMISLAWPVLGIITAGFVVIRIFKRVANKV